MRSIPTKSLLLIAATTFPVLTGVALASAQTLDTTYKPSKTMFAAKRSNVRSGPGTQYSKVGILEIGQLATVTAKTGNWFKLAPRPEQTMRFVYAPLLTETRPATAGVRSSKPVGPRRTIHNSGSRYHGHTRYGRPHGHGVMTYASGNRYEGGFVNGRREGWGVFTWTNGTRYEGEFVNGKRTGRGILTWPNGARHEGHWSNGDRHGEGWEMRADGTGFWATWRNDKVGKRDYRRESWESDRLRWLRKSGFETQAASAEQKPKRSSSSQVHDNMQASADAKERWGAFIDPGFPDMKESYLVVWNATSSDEAFQAALKKCENKIGVACWPRRYVEENSGRNRVPQSVVLFSTSSDAREKFKLLPDPGGQFMYEAYARCVLVYDSGNPLGDNTNDYETLWGISEDDVHRQFEEYLRDPKYRWLTDNNRHRVEFVACNDF